MKWKKLKLRKKRFFEGNFPSYFNYRSNGIAFAPLIWPPPWDRLCRLPFKPGVGGSWQDLPFVEDYFIQRR